MKDAEYPTDVVEALVAEVRKMSVTNDFYPLVILRAWSADRYVCVVYRYRGREAQFGLCLDVLDSEHVLDSERGAYETDARMTASRIRIGDLEELPPNDGLVLGSDGTQWWGDVGDAPRDVWDRPPPSGEPLTLNDPNDGGRPS